MPAHRCPGNRHWIQLVYDAMLLMPTAPVDARRPRRVPRRRPGCASAARTRPSSGAGIRDVRVRRGRVDHVKRVRRVGHRPGSRLLAAPVQPRATVTFVVNGNDTKARRCRWHGSSSATTRRASRRSPTPIPRPLSRARRRNLDATASFAPGVYELAVQAKGYGLVPDPEDTRPRAGAQYADAQPQQRRTGPPWQYQGATASGDGEDTLPALIDDTEATNWKKRGARDAAPNAPTAER